MQHGVLGVGWNFNSFENGYEYSAVMAYAMPDGRWAERRLIGRRGLRIALGVLWLLDAGLQAEPEKFTRDYPLGTLAQSVMGAPHWVKHSIYAGIDPFVAHWFWWILASTLIQVAIGVCLISG